MKPKKVKKIDGRQNNVVLDDPRSRVDWLTPVPESVEDVAIDQIPRNGRWMRKPFYDDLIRQAFEAPPGQAKLIRCKTQREADNIVLSIHNRMVPEIRAIRRKTDIYLVRREDYEKFLLATRGYRSKRR